MKNLVKVLGSAVLSGLLMFTGSLGWSDSVYFNPVIHNGKDAKYQFGNVYTCSNPAGTSVTTQAGLSATTPALTLHNVSTSTVVLEILDVGIDMTAAPAAAAGFMLALSTNVSAGSNVAAPTYGITQNVFTNTLSTGTAMCYRIVTLPGAPFAIRYLGGTTGAAAISGLQLLDPTGGKVMVAPGTAISIQSTSAAAIISHITYEEIPFP